MVVTLPARAAVSGGGVDCGTAEEADGESSPLGFFACPESLPDAPAATLAPPPPPPPAAVAAANAAAPAFPPPPTADAADVGVEVRGVDKAGGSRPIAFLLVPEI